MLRRAREQGWLERMFDRSGYSFTIPDRDENGFRALGELEDRAVNLVANALSAVGRARRSASSSCCGPRSASTSAA